VKDHIIIEHVQAGQPRPYADSIYSAYISKRREGVLTDGKVFYVQLTEPAVRELARLLVRRFDDKALNAWSPTLKECFSVEATEEMKKETGSAAWSPKPGCRWFVKIVEPYTD
jgi:hypothetical protein